MVARIFNDLLAWGILAAMGGLAFLLALIFKGNFNTSEPGPSVGDSMLRGLEAVILSMIGGLAARAFISILLGTANDSPAAGLAVGWGFFLVPGIVDTIPYLTHHAPILTSVNSLMMFATVVGGFSGAMNGLWRIYAWDGLGWIACPLDMTWGLAGNTTGCLLHIIDFAWGNHGDESRANAHRYASGFGMKQDYAFTQGAVMSNLSYGPGLDLNNHEMTHVWQNRAFGPLYTLTYLGWMVIWLIPSLVAAAIVQVISAPLYWCYFNNPWETWAYVVQNQDRAAFANTADEKKLVFSNTWVIVLSVFFFLGAIALAALTVKSVWIDKAASTKTTTTHSTAPGKNTSGGHPARKLTPAPAKGH
jgi:hypothetical protein